MTDADPSRGLRRAALRRRRGGRRRDAGPRARRAPRRGAAAPVEVLTTCARDHLTLEERAPARGEPRGGRGRPPLPGAAARHAAARLAPAAHPARLAAPPEGGGALGGGVGGEPGALRPPRRARAAEHDLVCFAPYLFGTTLARRAAGPGARRPDPVPPRRAVRPPRASSGEVFHACRGFIFNSPPEAALADKLYGIGDRPAGIVGLGFDPPPPADPDGVPPAPRARGPAPRLPRPQGDRGRTSPCSSSTPSATAPSAAPTSRWSSPGTARSPRRPARPGVRDLGYLDPAGKAAAYAAATVVCQPSVNESFSIVLMEAWLAGTPVLVHAPLRGHDASRPPARAAAWPSRTSTSSPRPSTSCSEDRERRGRLGARAAPTSRRSTAGRP